MTSSMTSNTVKNAQIRQGDMTVAYDQNIQEDLVWILSLLFQNERIQFRLEGSVKSPLSVDMYVRASADNDEHRTGVLSCTMQLT